MRFRSANWTALKLRFDLSGRVPVIFMRYSTNRHPGPAAPSHRFKSQSSVHLQYLHLRIWKWALNGLTGSRIQKSQTRPRCRYSRLYSKWKNAVHLNGGVDESVVCICAHYVSMLDSLLPSAYKLCGLESHVIRNILQCTFLVGLFFKNLYTLGWTFSSPLHSMLRHAHLLTNPISINLGTLSKKRKKKRKTVIC